MHDTVSSVCLSPPTWCARACLILVVATHALVTPAVLSTTIMLSSVFVHSVFNAVPPSSPVSIHESPASVTGSKAMHNVKRRINDY